MKKVYKYPLGIKSSASIVMLKNTEILKLDLQNNQPCIWAIVDINQTEMKARTFRTYGTGQALEAHPGEYIDSYQVDDGKLVFHVFETTEEAKSE